MQMHVDGERHEETIRLNKIMFEDQMYMKQGVTPTQLKRADSLFGIMEKK